MLKYPTILLLLSSMLSSCSSPGPLRVYEGQSGLNIAYNDADRLIGLTGLLSSQTAGNTQWVVAKAAGNKAVISLVPGGEASDNPGAFSGSFFQSIPGFDQGVTLWRYKPWNSWTKPMLVSDPKELEAWDIQFFYWQYEDGLYGSAMPLSGHGYRTTLGQHEGRFGAKSMSYGPGASTDTIPQMILGFGEDPHTLFKDLFASGLQEMGKTANQVSNKIFPQKLDYIGWCTWNASENGKLLNEDFVVDAVKTFTENDFPLGWVIVDDGWLDQQDRKINSFQPDSSKFPGGFGSLTRRLKEECNIKEVGIWHTLNGYWNGINPDSELGVKYREHLFSYYPKLPVTAEDSLNKHYFVKPGMEPLLRYYREMHQTLSDQGLTFLKVDNQLITEKMATGNYPLFTLSEKMHQALNQSAGEFFDGSVINCMDMTAEAYLNFGTSAVARAVEDYFPEHDGGSGYKIPYGNAAVHLVMAFYNSIYFQQMVFPDFDMFESYNPAAEFHAVARAINNGPVYVTDKPGRQDFDILRRLCYSDGRLIRPSSALTPSKECLFQLQDTKPFKAFSMDGTIGLLGVWNMADADLVSGNISANDLHGLQGDEFFLYEYFSKQHWKIRRETLMRVELNRMQTKLFFFIPTSEDAAAIGLVDKYNAPGTVVDQNIGGQSMKVTLADHGQFAAIIPNAPASVLVDDKKSEFSFDAGVLTVEIPKEDTRKNHTVEINW